MKKKVLTDLRVVCEPPSYFWLRHRTLEDQAIAWEKWCKEFNAFIRDHRSQDPVDLSVERVYEEQCSHCGYAWEVDEDGCPMCCEEAVQEWKSLQVKVD